jgi:phosphate transport system permease protein
MNANAASTDPRQAQLLVQGQKRKDVAFAFVGVLVLFVAIAMLLALVLDLAIAGVPQISWDFLSNFPSRRPSQAGILSAWVGTALVMIVTAVVALPLGVGAGLYLEEYAPKNWFTNIIEINVTNLAGVPSIIYGLLALGLFIQTFGMNESVSVAGLVLALLILPVVIVATREAVRAIPQEVREAAYGLGADKWQTVHYYILPSARPGILTGLIVGLSRAIGETAPVITIGALTFIAFLPPSPISGDFPYISFDWLNAPFTLLPIQMFNWVSRPQPAFHDLAAAAGIVLLAMTLLMNGLAIYIRYRLRRSMR